MVLERFEVEVDAILVPYFRRTKCPNGELMFFFRNPMQHVLFRRCEGRGEWWIVPSTLVPKHHDSKRLTWMIHDDNPNCGGFKYLLCSPRSLEKWSYLTSIFQVGWVNHQLAKTESWDLKSLVVLEIPEPCYTDSDSNPYKGPMILRECLAVRGMS